MTSLFTPDEMPRVAKTLKTLETTIDTVVCADESQHVRNHSWDRLARILNETFRKPRSIVQTIKPPKSAEEFGGFR